MLQEAELILFICLSPFLLLGTMALFGTLLWFFFRVIEFMIDTLMGGYVAQPTYNRVNREPAKVVLPPLPALNMDPKEMTPPFKVNT